MPKCTADVDLTQSLDVPCILCTLSVRFRLRTTNGNSKPSPKVPPGFHHIPSWLSCRNLSQFVAQCSDDHRMVSPFWLHFVSLRFTPRLLGPREGLGVSVQHSVEYWNSDGFDAAPNLHKTYHIYIIIMRHNYDTLVVVVPDSFYTVGALLCRPWPMRKQSGELMPKFTAHRKFFCSW